MTSLLEHRTWYTLRAAALAHGLGFDTTQTKQQGYERVRCALLNEGRLKRAFRALTPDEREPLIALRMAGGSLPLYEFAARFGNIRRYRPWREDSPRHPWRHPISASEKLWHLALVEIVRDRPYDRVVLVDEVRALLPPLPHPQIAAHPPLLSGSPRAFFCRDLAALLASLLADEARWLHGRWLTPRSMAAINRRMLIQEDIERSELRMGRLRFLHYAAHVAGLIAPHLPTPQAWMWMAGGGRWTTIWTAITNDLHARHPLWQQYGLPEVSANIWDALMAVLSRFAPGTFYTVESLYAMTRFHLSRRKLYELLNVLTWAGMIEIDGESFVVTPEDDGGSHPAQVRQYDGILYIDLPMLPQLRPLVEVWPWAQVESNRVVRIDADAVRRAVEQGYDAAQIVTALAELSGAPLQRSIVDSIRAWAKAAQRLTLRPLLVLTSPDAETLKTIRADWRLRPLLREPLSPHHLVVQTEHADELCRRLARRGLPVTQPKPIQRAAPSPSESEYAYLAARVYQQLGEITPPEVRVPGAVAKRLAEALPTERIEALDQIASAYVDKVRQTLTGRLVGQGGVEQDDPQGIRAAVESACEQRASITIVYYSPARGEETIRTIEPIMVYDRNGAAYIEAWCHLDEDTRTFRVDRIMRIVEADHGNRSGGGRRAGSTLSYVHADVSRPHLGSE